MAPVDLESMTVEALESKLKGAVLLRRIVIGIFALILGAWIVLGYWRSNTPVFITTIVLAVGVTYGASASAASVERELRRRRSGLPG